MTRYPILIAAGILLAVWCGADRPASAQATDSAALTDAERSLGRAYFLAGMQKFDAGEFRAAVTDFQKANAIARSFELVFNIGRCYEELGELDQAIEQYELAARLYPTHPDTGEALHRARLLRAVQDEQVAQQPPPKPAASPLAGLEMHGLTGLSYPVHGEARSRVPGEDDGRFLLPLTLGATYPLYENWLRLAVDLGAGYYFHDDLGLEPSSQWLFVGGLAGHFAANPMVSVLVDAGFALGWLTFVRYGNDGVMLVGGRLQVGCAVALTERWSLPILASALLGPLHSTSDDRIDVFADADAEIEVGLRVGVSYLLP